jgi:hypothetical protein
MAGGWILSPVTQCGLVAAVLGFALYLIGTVKVRVPGSGGREATPQAAPPEIRALQERLAELDARQRESEQQAGMEISAVRVRPGMNLSRRSQALRLHGRGETPEQIAGVLAVPAGEVRLLLKIHRIVMERAAGGSQRQSGLNSGPDSADKFSSAGKANRRSSESL